MTWAVRVPSRGRALNPLTTTDLFSTNFPVIEAPINGTQWVRGLQEGVAWQDPKATANGCVGSFNTFASRYSDDIAHLKSSYIAFGNDQYIEGVLYVAPGYTGNGGFHECELNPRFTITASNAQGYEFITGMGPGGLAYHSVVKWLGGNGSYTTIWDTQITPPAPPFPVDGLVVRAEVQGSVGRLYRNGVLFKTVDLTKDKDNNTITVYPSGQPGLGFWPADDVPGIGGIPENMGWHSWKAGNL